MLAIVLAVCLSTQSVTNTTPPISPSLLETAPIRFANALCRQAYLTVSATDIALEELEGAIFISLKASHLQPDDVDFWRMTLALGSLTGDMSPYAVEVSREALARLVKLSPTDQVLRLRRILQDIDLRETATDRVNAFKKYLTPEAIQVIQAPVASRIAFDLALFEARVGDVDGFANHLTQSLSLSSAFPAATEIAAGFINERIDDPVAECELLVAAALANPIETRSWSRLAALLLQEGAYGSAARICQITMQSMRLKEDMEPYLNLTISDYALALWGADRSSDAIQLLIQFMHDAKLKQATLIQTYNPQLSKADCAAVAFPLSPLVAMIDGTIRKESNHPEAAASVTQMIEAAIAQSELDDPISAVQTSAGKSQEPEEVRTERAQTAAKVLLDMATAAALIDADVSAVQGLLDLAERRFPLSDDSKIRFGAWKKLKAGDATGALTLINQSSSAQTSTLLIRAQILATAGDKKGAAKIYFDIARSETGSIIGLLAASRLKAIVGSGIPANQFVAKLDGVVASISPMMERYLSGLDLPISLRVVPEKELLEPFDPIRYKMTLTNQSVLPLAVGLAGPIKQQILLQPRISSTANSGVDRLQPQIVPFDRAIELAPGESMSMNWDLGWTEVGLRLGQNPIIGGIVEIRGASNFLATGGSFLPGAFGIQPSIPVVHVNGVRMNPEAIQSMIQSATDPKTDQDLVNIGLLAFAAKMNSTTPETAEAAWKAIAEGFSKLPSDAQAWVLLIGPRETPAFEPILDLARATTSGDVRAAYILGYCTTPDDPQLAAAIRSEDPFALVAAKIAAARFQREAVRAEERMVGSSPGAPVGMLDQIKNEQKMQNAPGAK